MPGVMTKFSDSAHLFINLKMADLKLWLPDKGHLLLHRKLAELQDHRGGSRSDETARWFVMEPIISIVSSVSAVLENNNFVLICVLLLS